MGIFLAEGEKVIRTYRCAKVDFTSSDSTLEAFGIAKRSPETDCTVTVTNRRVIYFAESKQPSRRTDMPSMHSQEAFIDRIASMEFLQAETQRRSLFPLLLMIVGVVVTVMALMARDTVFAVPGVALIAFGVGCFLGVERYGNVGLRGFLYEHGGEAGFLELRRYVVGRNFRFRVDIYLRVGRKGGFAGVEAYLPRLRHDGYLCYAPGERERGNSGAQYGR